MDDGDAYWPEVAGLHGVGSSLCSLCLLCCVDRLHSAGHGGSVSVSPRTASALVRIRQQRERAVMLFCFIVEDSSARAGASFVCSLKKHRSLR